MSELVVRPVAPTSAKAAELVAALDTYLSRLYPPASTHLLPAAELAAPGAVFLGAFLDGRPVGCCGYVPRPGGYAELKRLFVRPEARGRGVGSALVAALEHVAGAAGVPLLRAESGVRQPDALRLCERAGSPGAARSAHTPTTR